MNLPTGDDANVSHPSRVRGLKLLGIEVPRRVDYLSHPSRVRGLKQHPSGYIHVSLRRTLRGCVD